MNPQHIGEFIHDAHAALVPKSHRRTAQVNQQHIADAAKRADEWDAENPYCPPLTRTVVKTVRIKPTPKYRRSKPSHATPVWNSRGEHFPTLTQALASVGKKQGSISRIRLAIKERREYHGAIWFIDAPKDVRIERDDMKKQALANEPPSF